MDDSDLIEFVDEDAAESSLPELAPAWQILIVDDDEQVHETTRISLDETLILGRPLALSHAYSAREAEQMLGENPDYALALLDVVMESGDAGLGLVRTIRETLGLRDIRLILRTGQPGYAPELEVIRDYDINDYRTKSELSRTRLITSLTAALRSYEQICALNYSRNGLQKIIDASSELFASNGIKQFAEGVLTNIAGLVGAMPGGIVCARRTLSAGGDGRTGPMQIIGAMGRFVDAINKPLADLGDLLIEQFINQAVTEQRSFFSSDHTVLYLQTEREEAAIYIASGRHIEEVDRHLLEVFGSNIALGYSNVKLFEQLNFQAYNDVLTGLPNREGLIRLYDLLVSRDGRSPYVILLDIDSFSEINDALGMNFGNEVINAVAQRLRRELPPDAHVGRFGGDVLCVLAERNVISTDFILNLFISPFNINGYMLPIRVTAGVACAELGHGKPSCLEMFQHAGLALSRAKRNKRGGYERFEEAMARESRQRLHLSNALKKAVEDQALVLHYQPKIDFASGKTVGVEALIRWMGEDGELIPPGVFIPLAEQSGLILDIGNWVIDKAVAQLKQWQGTPFSELHVAINVSPKQILADTVVDALRDAIDRNHLQRPQLELEITESVVIEDFDKVIRFMQASHELGLKVALDDFGTGFSSLSYLQKLPIDTLKIDRAFISDAENNGRIAEMIVALARLLELDTVAEGIETEQQQKLATQWGCQTGQGFLYAKPMPIREFEQWQQSRS